MNMETRNKKRLCVFIVLVVMLDLTSGWIKLCYYGKNSMTVQGQVGGSVNISFCVRSDSELKTWIKIPGSGCGNNWCAHNSSLTRGSLTTTKVPSPYNYEYHILVQRYPIAQADFDKTFSMTLRNNQNNELILKYQIEQKETATSTTPNGLWLWTTPAASATPSSARTTEKCPTINTHTCPEDWSPIGDNKCLKVTKNRLNYSSAQRTCQEFKGELLNSNRDSFLFPCIGERLAITTTKSVWLEKCSSDFQHKKGYKIDYCKLELYRNTEEQANLSEEFSAACVINPDASASTTSAVTITTTAISTATTITECPTINSSKCPSNSFPVTGNQCLWVTNKIMNYRSTELYCQTLNGHPPSAQEAGSSLACIADKLTESKKNIWLQYGMCQGYRNSYCFFDTTTNKETWTYQEYKYSVVCLIPEGNFEPLSIVKFQAVINTTNRQDLLLLPKDWLKVYKDTSIGDSLNFSCQASGQPTPTAVILSTPKFPSYGQTVKKCGIIGNVSCMATNIFEESVQTETYQIIAKCPFKIKKFDLRFNPAAQGNKVTLTCTAEGYPKSFLTIIREDTGQELKRSQSVTVQYTEDLTFDLDSVTCDHMGSYRCQADPHDGNIQSNKAELQVSNCPVQLCRNETVTKDISLAVNQSTTVSLCLRYFRYSVDTTVFHKGKQIYCVSNKCQVKNTEITEIYHNMNIKLNNIQESDFGQWVFQMKNYLGSVNLTINLQAQESNSKGQTGNTGEGGHGGFNILHIVIPVVIIIVIASVVVGLVIYRKRGTGNNTSSHALFPGQESSVTYDHQGSVYANVDIHVYGNVSSAEVMRSRPQEQETRIDEADLNIPTDQETSAPDSGRYVSETGLVYITVQQASGNAKRQIKMKKPKRAKQVLQEQVEYVSLDYEKSGKMPVSEDDNMNESSNKDEAEDDANSDQTSEGDSSH